MLTGQVKLTLGAVVTVKEALHVFVASQLLVTVQVTVFEPPHAAGAPVLLLLMETLQPPVLEKVLSQFVNLVLMLVCVWQAASVTFTGQVSTTEAGAVTVNTAEHVLLGSQLDVTVHVTVLEPPQAGGALPPLFERAALQPPLKVAEFNHVVYAASIAAWVWQAAWVLLEGQVSTTAGAAVTVNTAEQVLVSQEEVTVQVTVLEPPHAEGAAPPLLERLDPEQPPE